MPFAECSCTMIHLDQSILLTYRRRGWAVSCRQAVGARALWAANDGRISHTSGMNSGVMGVEVSGVCGTQAPEDLPYGATKHFDSWGFRIFHLTRAGITHWL